MRTGSKGCVCDSCITILEPNEAIKIKAYKKVKEDSTGRYKAIHKLDLCPSCYEDLILSIKTKPSKNIEIPGRF